MQIKWYVGFDVSQWEKMWKQNEIYFIQLDVTTSMTHLAQIQNFKLVTTDNDVQAVRQFG